MTAPEPSGPRPLAARVRAATPARLFLGGPPGAYRTATWLQLQADHAVARDAVGEALDLSLPPMRTLVDTLGLFEVRSMVTSPAEYRLRPDRGRSLSDEARTTISERVTPGADLQVVVGDGLSATAVHAQVPALLPQLVTGAADRGWRVGQPFAIRYCRVGVLNDVGDVLRPGVVVLLIGERPGLATAESLSAYFAWQPTAGHTDAQRNLISNIHGRGVPVQEAVGRILDLAELLRTSRASGVTVREADRAALPPGE